MKTRYLIIIFISILLVFAGCKKKKEVQLEGSWLEVPISVQPEEYTITWTFNDDNTLEINNDGDIELEAEYSMEYKFPKFYIDMISLEFRGYDYSGRYRVDELNDDFLKITRIELADGSPGAAFYRWEFMRE